MKKRYLILAACILFISTSAFAQIDPVKWSFTSKKIGDKLYELTFSAAVSDPWHIYSQSTPEGGPLPTKIRFNKNPLITMLGGAKEKGKLVQKYEEVFDVDVKYFNGNVVFVQQVKLKANAKTTISGGIEFMACTDERCLPPTEIKFSLKLE